MPRLAIKTSAVKEVDLSEMMADTTQFRATVVAGVLVVTLVRR